MHQALNLSADLYTPSSGYVRHRGDGQKWHVASSQTAAAACGPEAPTLWGWPQWTTQSPAAPYMCPRCLPLDPRRHGAERRESVR